MDALTLLKTRTSPGQLVEPGPTPEQLNEILSAGASAPDHGRMQPWRFIIIAGESRMRFGAVMADSLRRREPTAPAGKIEAEAKKALRAPVIIVVAASVSDNPKVPAVEQIVAVGAATQNMMLAAHALGYGAFWRTGPVAYDEQVKQALGLAAEDAVVGILYLGSIGLVGKPRAPVALDAVSRHW